MGGNLLVKNLQPFRNGPPRGIRTPDTQVRSLVLYPAELWADRFQLKLIPVSLRTQVRSPHAARWTLSS